MLRGQVWRWPSAPATSADPDAQEGFRTRVRPGLAVAFCCALVLTAAALTAGDFYVDPVNGNDVSGQGTASKPWQTIGYALGQVSPPPAPLFHTVHLLAGLYDTVTGETFPITVPAGFRLKGAARSQSIVYGTGQPGVPVFLFQGTHDARSGLCELGISDGDPAVSVTCVTSGAAGPLIECCRLAFNDVGVRVAPASANTCAPTMRACEAFNNVKDAVVLIGASGGCVAGSIDSCRFDNNTGNGIRIEGTAGGVCTRIANCTVIDNQGVGLLFRGSTTSTAVITHCTMRGNVAAGMRAATGSETNGLVIRNTISYGQLTDLDNVRAANVRFCCFGNTKGTNPPTGGTNGNLQSDPLFKDPGEATIKPFSPVIDRGDANGSLDPGADLDGDQRTIDGNGDAIHLPDMGADEFTPLWTSGFLPFPGGITSFHVDLPTNRSIPYAIGLSFSATGIRVPGGRTIPLWPDPLLALVVTNQLPFITGFAGTMNGSGFATGRVQFPNDSRLRGIAFHAAAITLDTGYPGGIRCVTNGLAFVLQ